MADYGTITEDVKQELLTTFESVFTVNRKDDNGQGRPWSGVTPQFKGFPSKYILEGVEAGAEPEDIADQVYHYMKNGRTPEFAHKHPQASPLYTGVPMRPYAEGPDMPSEQENMLRFACGKLLVKLRELSS